MKPLVLNQFFHKNHQFCPKKKQIQNKIEALESIKLSQISRKPRRFEAFVAQHLLMNVERN